jgi:hypothetical protein
MQVGRLPASLAFRGRHLTDGERQWRFSNLREARQHKLLDQRSNMGFERARAQIAIWRPQSLFA